MDIQYVKSGKNALFFAACGIPRWERKDREIETNHSP